MASSTSTRSATKLFGRVEDNDPVQESRIKELKNAEHRNKHRATHLRTAAAWRGIVQRSWPSRNRWARLNDRYAELRRHLRSRTPPRSRHRIEGRRQEQGSLGITDGGRFTAMTGTTSTTPAIGTATTTGAARDGLWAASSFGRGTRLLECAGQCESEQAAW